MNRVWLIVLASACWGQSADPLSSGGADTPPAAKAPSATPAPPASAAPASARPTQQSAAPASSFAAMTASQAAMAASIEKQRTSVVKQVGAVTGKNPPAEAAFFTVPWVDVPPKFGALSGAAFNEPPCDPMPSEQLDPLIEENAKRESVRPDLVRAVIGEESASRPCAVSPKGAQGLMQLMPSVAEQFGVIDPFDPKQNIEAGTKLLKQLLTKYGGDIRLALSAYNAGTERVDREGGVPQIPETINYVTDILSKLPKQ